MSKLNFSLRDWETEKMNDLMRAEAKRIDHEEGFNAGVEQGIEQNTIEMIQQMLKNNASLDFISKVAGKTIEEIKKIAETMK